jgi:hypothetical protein
MSRNIALAEELYNKTAELAAREHASVEEFVSVLLANRVASREFIESRGELFGRADFERALQQVPDVEPEEYDRLCTSVRSGRVRSGY